MTDFKVSDLVDEEQLRQVDREFQALLAQCTNGMSPIALSLAMIDWISHLAISPGRQLYLLQNFIGKVADLNVYAVQSIFIDALEGPASTIERRMTGVKWDKWPFKVFAQAHQVARDLLQEAAFGVDGVDPQHEVIVHSVAERVLEMMSPANFPLTNPEVLETTVNEGGQNLLRGLKFAIKDVVLKITKGKFSNNRYLKEPPSRFKIGQDLAATPGKVVFKNSLMELVQYTPVTEKVGAEPVLISPAWIMKYYILDLSPKNSLVKYLIEQGKTVFAISWKNPNEDDSSVGFEDYVQSGIMAAINTITTLCPKRKIHGVGYCIGGTLLAATAAAMAGKDDDRLQTISLFAAQTDFSEAGEISRYIGKSQLSFLEKLMWKQGYLSSESMGSTFSSLRTSDLIYGARVDRYLLGKESDKNDLMSWNADGTRMPHRMHSEYLQAMYLENRLAKNQFTIEGKIVSLSDIRIPIYCLGTETDHVAPWQSVFKIHQLVNGELTFALTSGGHNAGVISGPEHPRRRFRVHTRIPGDKYLSPDDWVNVIDTQDGSWWPNWNLWLDNHMSSMIKPPSVGSAKKGIEVIYDAPGQYVLG